MVSPHINMSSIGLIITFGLQTSVPPPLPFIFWLTSVLLRFFRHWVIGTERKKAKTRLYDIHTILFLFPSFLCLSYYWHAWSHHRIKALQSWQCAWCSTLWPRCVWISWQPFSCHHPLTLSAWGRKLPGSFGQKAHIYCRKYVDLCSWQNLQVLLCIMFLRQAQIKIPILKLKAFETNSSFIPRIQWILKKKSLHCNGRFLGCSKIKPR